MRSVGQGRRFAAAACVFALTGLVTAPAWAAEDWRLRAPELSRPVGLATDDVWNRYWTANGGWPGTLRVFAFDDKGEYLGAVTSRDTVQDVQALAWQGRRLFVGDVGGQRSEVTIFYLRTPWQWRNVSRARVYKLTYPDGPHTAKAIFLDDDFRVHVVTWGSEGGAIYKATGRPKDGVTDRLERVSSAPAGIVDAAHLADGRVALRSASTLYTLDASLKVVKKEAIQGRAEGVLAQSLDATSLLVAPQAAGAPVTSVKVPDGAVRRTPRPTTAPEDSDAVAPAPAGPVDLTSGGAGLAAVAAGGAAALAALVVAAKR